MSLITLVKQARVDRPHIQGKIQSVKVKSGINLRKEVTKISVFKTKNNTLVTVRKVFLEWS